MNESQSTEYPELKVWEDVLINHRDAIISHGRNNKRTTAELLGMPLDNSYRIKFVTPPVVFDTSKFTNVINLMLAIASSEEMVAELSADNYQALFDNRFADNSKVSKKLLDMSVKNMSDRKLKALISTKFINQLDSAYYDLFDNSYERGCEQYFGDSHQKLSAIIQKFYSEVSLIKNAAVTLSLEPLDILRATATDSFTSCLSPANDNAYMTFMIAAAPTMGVLYFENADGKIIGRCWISVSETDVLVLKEYGFVNKEMIKKVVKHVVDKINTDHETWTIGEPLGLYFENNIGVYQDPVKYAAFVKNADTFIKPSHIYRICPHCGETFTSKSKNITCDKCHNKGIDVRVCTVCKKAYFTKDKKYNNNICKTCEPIIQAQTVCLVCGKLGADMVIQVSDTYLGVCQEHLELVRAKHCQVCGVSAYCNPLYNYTTKKYEAVCNECGTHILTNSKVRKSNQQIEKLSQYSPTKEE